MTDSSIESQKGLPVSVSKTPVEKLRAAVRRYMLALMNIGKLLCFWLVVKLVWVPCFAISGDKLLQGCEQLDLSERRAYLLAETSDDRNIWDGVPVILGDQFKGEWALVTSSMLATALTNFSFLYPHTRMENLKTINRLIAASISARQREFDRKRWREDPLDSLSGSGGHVGYLGHVNFMLGAYRLAGGSPKYDQLLVSISDSLTRRYESSDFPMIETYPAEIYAADNVVVVASLANASRAMRKSGDPELSRLAGRIEAVVDQWVQRARTQAIDGATGALAFSYSGRRIKEGSRGSGV